MPFEIPYKVRQTSAALRFQYMCCSVNLYEIKAKTMKNSIEKSLLFTNKKDIKKFSLHESLYRNLRSVTSSEVTY